MDQTLMTDPLRVCIPDFGGFAHHAYRAAMFEAQDVLAETANVDFIPMVAQKGLARREGMLGRAVRYDFSRQVWKFNPGIRPARLDQDYDLFVAVCPWWRDVWYCNAIENWKERARISVCWIDELWISEISSLGCWLPALERFDYVFVGIDGSADYLGQRIGVPKCHDLPAGADALRFAPKPADNRPIDILSVGRRVPAIHQALKQLSGRDELFYLFDTLESGNSRVQDHREHRSLYAERAKRAKFFMVAPGKWDATTQSAGQSATGTRYYEGAAAGAILLGQRPDTRLFRETFPWPESVVELASDGNDTQRIVADLMKDPERMSRIAARNASQSLRRHDWIYRWKRIFDICGLPITQGMNGRIAKLESAARALEARFGIAQEGATLQRLPARQADA